MKAGAVYVPRIYWHGGKHKVHAGVVYVPRIYSYARSPPLCSCVRVTSFER